MNFFISSIERAFKTMKNGMYFIVIALLVAELFKMTCNITLWAQNDVNPQKNGISLKTFFIELKLCTVVALNTKFHDISTVTFPWQWNGLQALSIQKLKSEFSPSRSVVCSCCLFSGCELIWTLRSASTRKCVRLCSNK